LARTVSTRRPAASIAPRYWWWGAALQRDGASEAAREPLRVAVAHVLAG
jgi:hypothetical protein